jgi:hypothetical protein
VDAIQHASLNHALLVLDRSLRELTTALIDPPSNLLGQRV